MTAWDRPTDQYPGYGPSAPTPAAQPTSGLPFYVANDQAFYGGQVDPSTVPSQYSQDYSRIWGFNQGLNAGQVQAGPQFALNQSSRDSLAQQLALTQASQQSQTGYLNQDYNIGLGKLGLQGQSLDVQRGALARQPQYLSTLHDLANQAYQQSADVASRSQMSSATARGSVNTPGNIQHLDDISNQLANQLGRSDTQYNEQVSSLADQNKMLDVQSKNLGLSRDALQTELNRGLDRLGLSTSMSIADLTQKMNSSNIEDQVLAQQIFNAAMQSSDYYSQFYPQQAATPTTPATSTTPTPAPTARQVGVF